MRSRRPSLGHEYHATLKHLHDQLVLSIPRRTQRNLAELGSTDRCLTDEAKQGAVHLRREMGVNTA